MGSTLLTVKEFGQNGSAGSKTPLIEKLLSFGPLKFFNPNRLKNVPLAPFGLKIMSFLMGILTKIGLKSYRLQ